MMPVSVPPQTTGGESAPTCTLSQEQLREICEQAKHYLSSTQAYLRPDLSLAVLAKETGIPQRNLSRAINTHLQRNFFEFINEMRVEEAKRRLLQLETSGYNIDSIFAECGFRSRSTFFLVFKRVEGKTPAAWLAQTHKSEPT